MDILIDAYSNYVSKMAPGWRQNNRTNDQKDDEML